MIVQLLYISKKLKWVNMTQFNNIKYYSYKYITHINHCDARTQLLNLTRLDQNMIIWWCH